MCVAFYIFWQKVILLAGAWFLWCTVFHSPVTRTGSDKFLAGRRENKTRPFPQNRQQSFLSKTQGGRVGFSVYPRLHMKQKKNTSFHNSEYDAKRVALAVVVLSCYFVSHVLSCRKHSCYTILLDSKLQG